MWKNIYGNKLPEVISHAERYDGVVVQLARPVVVKWVPRRPEGYYLYMRERLEKICAH